MANFLFYDQNFNPTFIQSFPDGEIPKLENCIEVEEFKDLSCFYFENGSLKTRDKQPDYFHDWNGSEWVVNNDRLSLNKSENVKAKRLNLLIQSDWTDTVTAQTRLTNWQEWQTYRQELRDIPMQKGYPTDIVWPTQPT